jgi:hypothetical protein
LPVLETLAALERIEAEPVIRLEAVVANRLLPELAVTAETIATLPVGAHREAAMHHQALRAQHQQWLESLPKGPRLPYLFGIHTAGEVAEQLSDIWDAQI